MRLYRFRTRTAFKLAMIGGGLLAFPFLLWGVGVLGDCVASSSGSHCAYLPDLYASILFAFYVFLVFGGWILSIPVILVAGAMLVIAYRIERDAWHGQRD